MSLKSALVTFSCLALAFALSGCGLLGGKPTSGVAVLAKGCLQNTKAPTGVLQCLPGTNLTIIPYVPVWGNKTGDCYGPWTQTPAFPSCSTPADTNTDYTKGTLNSFGQNGLQPLQTPESGPLVVNNAEAPAFWNLNWLVPYPCGNNTNPQLGPIYQGQVYYESGNYSNDWWWMEIETGPLDVPVPNYYSSAGGYAELDCYVPPPWILPASTRFAILGNLPNTLTLSSRAPLITQYGMPLLYLYNNAGSVVATETATSVSSDGSQATFPFPSTLPQSGYSLALVNQTGGGVGFAPAGDNLLSIASSQTIAGNPFGVSVGALTDSYTYINPCSGDGSSLTGSNYSTFPIVSLYSMNQVIIGSAAVNVGANPTAVVTYASSPVQKHFLNARQCINNYDIYSGTTRAIVANSGTNTVSILDIVNNALLYTVTVGNQPVALAVSSDGSTAFVANYNDSTVTQVNLNSGTVTSTIAVGGKPMSVALTSSGVLWVGGVGFLSKINTQNMSVTATQSTSGKTITALAFSDSVGELVATSTDTNGNVAMDEVNPGTVQTGSAYATVASHAVSTLGTYYNSHAQAQVRAFTGTLGSSSIPINANLPGSPPLVVQDGWAVVTATPTGFTITDITGHIVLISESTPSPIAAIAIDANLSAAYLTMPDSNTLLTVPLPGVGTNQ